MRAEDLLTRIPSPEAVAKETEKLPEPSAEARASLRQTLEASARPATPTPWPALLQEARGKMDSRYAGPVTSHRGGLSGPALVLAKKAFRLVFQPFINEALRKQVEFNESILDALATIHDVQREHARTHATWRQDVERRLARIEDVARSRASHEAAGGVTPEPSTTERAEQQPSAPTTDGKAASPLHASRETASAETKSSPPRTDGEAASPPRASRETASAATKSSPPKTDGEAASPPHASRETVSAETRSSSPTTYGEAASPPRASRETDSTDSSSRAPRRQGASNESPESPPRPSGGSSRRRSGRR
ncbi:hypothetical protein [Myxococcus sp. CA033]|uniref:hypothetical protein n=1 Tax=Myxococcus sp. CA033 TaxID=2741516 RepID=UPI0020C5EA28|nr:hypothetical protein [Myxococcus sp. CA033]